MKRFAIIGIVLLMALVAVMLVAPQPAEAQSMSKLISATGTTGTYFHSTPVKIDASQRVDLYLYCVNATVTNYVDFTIGRSGIQADTVNVIRVYGSTAPVIVRDVRIDTVFCKGTSALTYWITALKR